MGQNTAQRAHLMNAEGLNQPQRIADPCTEIRGDFEEALNYNNYICIHASNGSQTNCNDIIQGPSLAMSNTN